MRFMTTSGLVALLVASHRSQGKMLRVEASNLAKPKKVARSRPLLPDPSTTRPATGSRALMLPPPDESSPPSPALALPPHDSRAIPSDRWSVQLELSDEEIAKLYSQGLTHGAVVWKKGMAEWRPLLITAELADLLRRTRRALTQAPLPATAGALPRPARLPSDFPAELANRPVTPITVAPTAIDVPPAKPRRSVELAAVALAAFALAWLGRDRLAMRSHGADGAEQSAAVTSAPLAPICEPANATARVAAAERSNIPTLSIADLPLLGAASPASGTHARIKGPRAQPSDAGPGRAQLLAALSQVARSASSCGERGGPVRLVMSFGSTGVARGIRVSGSDLPAATRSCIIRAASRAHVPAFSGDPVTIGKTL